MLFQKKFIKIGFIRKAHGVFGHAKVVIEEDFIDDFEQSKFVFLNMDGCYVPFEILDFHESGDQILKLDSFNNPEEIKQLSDPSLFLVQEELKFLAPQSGVLSQTDSLSGFELWDINKGRLGIIDRIEEYPQQLMLVLIQADLSEKLIPLHDHLIDRIELEHKKIIMDLPDGLLTL